jgi:SAM-dependent methyltransferase
VPQAAGQHGDRELFRRGGGLTAPADSGYRRRLEALYLPRLDRHRIGPEAQAWPNIFEQSVRFIALADIGIKPDDTVLDAGCGLGDFATYLGEHDFQGRYIGIDALPQMVERARRARFADGFDISFDCADIRDAPERWQADIVVASGIFVEMTEEEARETIAALFRACRRGVAFTSLSSWDRSENAEGFLRLDPLRTLDFCRTLSPRLLLRHEYFYSDFAIYMYRDLPDVN